MASLVHQACRHDPRARRSLPPVLSRSWPFKAAATSCAFGDIVLCPGSSGATCGGDQCGSEGGTGAAGSFPCPSASLGFSGCAVDTAVSECCGTCLPVPTSPATPGPTSIPNPTPTPVPTPVPPAWTEYDFENSLLDVAGSGVAILRLGARGSRSTSWL
ncbi:unnamed protein product [Prorocentrum cordatum]|uniref:Uncharacterized protein n=1 Tax=Prorocentrum cordatum TaxID=2364126 RepID=A0ABN9PU56_9DINO|nr:unnamed protein product [Polarella glacialis]